MAKKKLSLCTKIIKKTISIHKWTLNKLIEFCDFSQLNNPVKKKTNPKKKK